ncbi:MAG: cadherin domain-containing protein, partial [Bacteroidales bacterium]|nr:cadherin domain-containing protein [Bacteroidales bacterium]
EGAPFSSDAVVSDDYDKKEITQNQTFLNNKYEIIGGDKEFFDITSGGVIKPKNGVVLDYETKNEYEIDVRVRDANVDADGDYFYPDLYEDKTFKIVVTDVDDAPKFESSIYNGTVDENSVKDTKVIFNPVIKATTSQKGAVITYSLVDETNSFVINPTTGVISVAEGAVLDYETKNTYNLKVVASDESGVAGQTVQTATTSVVIKLIDLNEKPIFVEPATPLEFDEHVKDAIVGTLTYDDLDTASMFRNDKYECTDCDDKGFDIDEDTGVLKTTRAFDYETEEHTYELNIVIYDASDKNLTATGTVTVTLRDVNEPPFLKETVFSVLESDPVVTVLNKNVEGVDIDGPDISFNYFIMNGENEGQETNEFHLDPKTGKITVLSKLDYEMASSYSFKVRVRDEHDSYSDTTVTINVVDVNEAPHFTNKTAVIEIPENASFSSNKVIYEDTDKYNDFVKNELVILEGKDSEFFDITSDGVIKPKNGVVLDYEVKQEYEIDVRVRDANTDDDCNYIYPDLYEDKTFKVVVTEAEEPDPTLISAETADNLKVWTARRTVYIQSAVGTEYRIVALDGRPIVASATKTAKDEILLPETGCYVLTINNKSYKIIVY